ncbi:MAG: amidase, partial [Gammaproteobacteria bacterium]
GKYRGPLHGIPYGLKDLFAVKGTKTTWGAAPYKDQTIDEDSYVYTKLKESGAVLVAKFTLGALAMGDWWFGGRTKNPWHFDYSPGSSSGGEAAAIASGIVPFGIGEDTTCSLRLPAHYCGITTIKPSSGRVPRTGHIPNPGNILDGLWQLGPLAREVRDLEIILAIISGPDWIDPSVVPMPLVDSELINLSQIRIAYHTDNKVLSPESAIQNAIIYAVDILKNNVKTITHAIPAGQDQATELCSKLYSLDKGRFIQRLLKSCGTTDIHPSLLKLLSDLETNFAELDVNQVLSDLYHYQSRLLTFFADHDVLICPAMPSTARTPAEINKPFVDQNTDFNKAYNYYVYQIAYCLLGLPMMIVPICLNERGLPITVQLVGAPWSEAVLFRVGKFIEEKIAFHDNYIQLFSRLYT